MYLPTHVVRVLTHVVRVLTHVVLYLLNTNVVLVLTYFVLYLPSTHVVLYLLNTNVVRVLTHFVLYLPSTHVVLYLPILYCTYPCCTVPTHIVLYLPMLYSTYPLPMLNCTCPDLLPCCPWLVLKLPVPFSSLQADYRACQSLPKKSSEVQKHIDIGHSPFKKKTIFMTQLNFIKLTMFNKYNPFYQINL